MAWRSCRRPLIEPASARSFDLVPPSRHLLQHVAPDGHHLSSLNEQARPCARRPAGISSRAARRRRATTLRRPTLAIRARLAADAPPHVGSRSHSSVVVLPSISDHSCKEATSLRFAGFGREPLTHCRPISNAKEMASAACPVNRLSNYWRWRRRFLGWRTPCPGK